MSIFKKYLNIRVSITNKEHNWIKDLVLVSDKAGKKVYEVELTNSDIIIVEVS